MPARDETWQVVMPADDLWEGELTGIRLGAKNIVLLNDGGEIRAFEDRCPHLGFQLSQGQGTNPGNCQLAVFGTRVRAGQIEILAPGPE